MGSTEDIAKRARNARDNSSEAYHISGSGTSLLYDDAKTNHHPTTHSQQPELLLRFG